MVTDLASNERYEDVLQGIVGSSAHAVLAPGAILALEARTGSPRKIYWEGLTEDRGGYHRRDILEGGAGRQGVVAVDVTSVRRHYGVLAVDERGGVFTSQSGPPSRPTANWRPPLSTQPTPWRTPATRPTPPESSWSSLRLWPRL